MLRDITLGQFFPGNSVLHRADPRTKLILTFVYIIGVFLCKSVWSFALLFAGTTAVVILSAIPVRLVLKSVKPIIIIVIFTGLINLFMTRGDGDPLFEYKFIKIYADGVKYAVLMILRITSLVVGTSVILTYTTSPIALTDGLEQLLAPLKKIKFPVHEFSMMMTIALRFIPTLIEETDKIMSAQKARGADFATGGLVKRAKALIPVLVPLFISAFRRAAELATAMECRCYHGGEGRTRMNVLRYSALDFILMAAFAAFIAGLIMLNMI